MTSRYRRAFDLMLGGRGRAEAELDAEIETHVSMRTSDLVRLGMSPPDAAAEARRRFGNFDDARRQLRAGARRREAAMRKRHWFQAIRSDLAYAVRRSRHAPGFTLVVVATLAIGIASTTSIFTLVNGILLRPLPFGQPNELVILGGRDSTKRGIQETSAADWLDRRNAQTLASSALYSRPFRQSVILQDSATRVDAVDATSGFFTTLRAPFVLGRGFGTSDLSGDPVAVVSERTWRHLLGADPRLGMRLRTPLGSYTVIGVVKQGHEFPAGTDLWFPVRVSRTDDPVRYDMNWYAIARLRPGITNAQAAAEVGEISRAVRASGDPTAIYDYGADVVPLSRLVIGDVDGYLKLLMGVVMLVLLIVCANVAASSVARGATRAREMAIRASLGAGRARLVVQVLIEHLWLGILGGAAGLFGGWLIARLVLARWGSELPRADTIAMDWRVAAFAVAASLVAGLVSGCLPAMLTRRAAPRDALAGGRAVKGGRGIPGAALVVGEIALAMLLLAGATLLIRSFRSLMARDIGFDTNVATATLTLSGPGYADSLRRVAFWEQLVASYRQIPGVQAVGLAQWVPLDMTGAGFVDLYDRPGVPASAAYRTVNEDFFTALGMRILMGRALTAADGRAADRVVVINQTMAKDYFAGANPIGKMIRARSMEAPPGTDAAPWRVIVGVVSDIRADGLQSDPRPEMYVHYAQTPNWTGGLTALVRSSEQADVILPELRRRAAAIDPTIAVDLGRFSDRLNRILAQRTLSMSLLTAFAAVALTLAALGIYGVLSYAVARRTRELAVRSALGARRAQLLALVAASGFRVVMSGLILGAVGVFALTRLLASMLVGVKPLDAMSLMLALAALLVASGVAIAIPALRATKLDPTAALRME